MMKVSLASTTYDLAGYIEIDLLPNNTDGQTTRRVTRVTTLDGGVAVTDRGYAEGDRTLTYTWQSVSEAHSESVARLVRLYPEIYVYSPEAVYLAAPETFRPGVDESSLSILVKDKVSN